MKLVLYIGNAPPTIGVNLDHVLWNDHDSLSYITRVSSYFIDGNRPDMILGDRLSDLPTTFERTLARE